MKSFKEYLTEATVKELVDGTRRFQNETNAKVDRFIPQANSIKIEKITPFFGTKIVIFSGNINSFTDPKKYNTTIQFEGVEFASEKLSPEYVLLEQYDKWMRKPKIDKNNSRCRCNCDDWRFRAQIALKKHNSLFGKIISYDKKTDRPPLNPDEIPMLCKHLINLNEALLENGWIQN